MMEKLQARMALYPAGPMEDTEELDDVLASYWHELDGSDEGGMEGRKLKGRMEATEWNPPLLTFNIERHGATVNGSVYAEVQHWSVNVDTGEASLKGSRRRQVSAKDKPLKVGPLVEEIIAAIVERANDHRLKWDGDQKVRVLISSVISATNNQTRSARHKRFWDAMEEKIEPLGWTRLSPRSSYLQKQMCILSSISDSPPMR
jgi:hypothetical protein